MTVRTRLSNRIYLLPILALLSVFLVPDVKAGPSRDLPKRFLGLPYSLMSLSVGHPNHGWQLRAKKLQPGNHLTIKSNSRNNSYGHPALVLMLRRSAKDVARAAPGSVMLVGDLSSKHGGRLFGHTSHQSGRDADVGFYVSDARGNKVVPQQFVSFGADGRATDGSGLVFDDWRNWLLLQSWAIDKRAGLSHVFISQPLKRRLIAFAHSRPDFKKYIHDALKLLKQPERHGVHDDHFHVRIACPKNQQEICHEHSR